MQGNEAELLFVKSCKAFTDNIIQATEDQDRFEHWDYMVEGVKYDVKGRKKVHIWDKEYTPDIIVEILNVMGNTAWSRGKADFIAFEQENDFLIVPREPLYLQAVNNLKMVKGQGYYEQYFRKCNKEKFSKGLVTLLPKEDVLKLPNISRIKKIL